MVAVLALVYYAHCHISLQHSLDISVKKKKKMTRKQKWIHTLDRKGLRESTSAYLMLIVAIAVFPKLSMLVVCSI